MAVIWSQILRPYPVSDSGWTQSCVSTVVGLCLAGTARLAVPIGSFFLYDSGKQSLLTNQFLYSSLFGEKVKPLTAGINRICQSVASTTNSHGNGVRARDGGGGLIKDLRDNIIPFLLQVLEQFPFSFEFNSLFLEVNCHAFLVNYWNTQVFIVRKRLRNVLGNCREKKKCESPPELSSFSWLERNARKVCTVLEVSRTWGLFGGVGQYRVLFQTEKLLAKNFEPVVVSALLKRGFSF